MFSAAKIILVFFIGYFLFVTPLLAQKVMRFPDGEFYNIEGIDPEKVAKLYKEMQELIDAENEKNLRLKQSLKVLLKQNAQIWFLVQKLITPQK